MSGNRYATRYQSQTVRKRRRRMRQRLIKYGLLTAVAAAAVILIYTLISNAAENRRIQAELSAYENTFQPGVSINGMELTGYSYDEARNALNAQYAAGLEEEVLLTFADRTWTFVPAQAGATIDLESRLQAAWAIGKEGTDEQRLAEIRDLVQNPVDLSAELTFDEAEVSRFVSEIKQEIDCEPINATRTVTDMETFVFTDSAVGYRLDAAALEAQLAAIILGGGADRIELQPEVLQPSPSRAELEAASVMLAECTTSLEGSSTRRSNNVNLALGYFNYLEVEPGQKISFNRLVGKRTEENGFYEAPEYAGTTVITGIGGGVCQASTTVYGAVIRAGLKINERHAHTMKVGYVEASQDAAVNNNDKDLVFTNTTDGTLFFFAWTNARKETATVRIYGKPKDINVQITVESVVTQMDIESDGITYQEDTEGTRVWYTDDPPVFYQKGKSGMRSTAYRVYYDLATGEELEREKLSSDYYAPQNDVYLIGVHTRE